jgi:hypothetical protein
VAFFVEFVPSVLEYLGRVDGLTDVDRAAVVDEITEELARDADRFLALYPLAHESLCLLYDYARPCGNAVFSFDFVVDASALSMGVVGVVYVECTAQPRL